jgi:restriction endonuclease S subunit
MYPNDWAMRKVGDFCKLGRGRVISKIEIDANRGKYPVYSSQTSNNGEMGRINTYDFEGEYLTWTTDGANAGKVFYRNGKFNCTNVCGTIKSHDESVDMQYLVYQLGKITPTYVSYNLANPKLMNGVMARIPVPLPPLPEQHKIAAILGTWDSAIATAERLVAVLRARKKALMQRLLTGQVRFQQFGSSRSEDDVLPSGWQRRRLEEAFQRVQRTVPVNIEHVLSITATVGFVDQQGKFGRVIAGKNLEHYIYLRKAEFAYNKGNSGSYPQGCIYQLEEFEEGAVPNVYYCFSPKSEQICGDFYKYYFESGILNSQLRRLINSGVRNDGLLNLSSGEFFGTAVIVPPQQEQKAIANVLICADREIVHAKKMLNHLQSQKN